MSATESIRGIFMCTESRFLLSPPIIKSNQENDYPFFPHILYQEEIINTEYEIKKIITAL